MSYEVHYLILMLLITVLYGCWNKLERSILNFFEYKIHKENPSNWEKVKNIIYISIISLFAIFILFIVFIDKKEISIDPVWIFIFLIVSLILTYTLTIIFNVSNMKLQKRYWTINKDTTYKEFLHILKENSDKEKKLKEEKLHNDMKEIKEKIRK